MEPTRRQATPVHRLPPALRDRQPDDALGKLLIAEIRNGTEVLSYGTNGSELRGSVLQMDSSGMSLRIASQWGGGEVRSGLLGAFNVSNLLAAAGTLALLGMPWSRVMQQLEFMHAVPGRMHCPAASATNRWWSSTTPHTPVALRQLLVRSARAPARPAGLRVRLRRRPRRRQTPLMAAVAEELADRVVLTSDNPRGEELAAILRDMLQGRARPDQARSSRTGARPFAGPSVSAAKATSCWWPARAQVAGIKGQKVPSATRRQYVPCWRMLRYASALRIGRGAGLSAAR
jgi:UDP-N-acetylmuramoyl-L-alanyl-D-glutamate--2,6-diaminopimelate ligase